MKTEKIILKIVSTLNRNEQVVEKEDKKNKKGKKKTALKGGEDRGKGRSRKTNKQRNIKKKMIYKTQKNNINEIK